MKKTVNYIFPLVCLFMLVSCEKEGKPYKGEPQIAFALKTYTYNVSNATNSVSVPVQLIADAPQGAINATVNVDAGSTNCSSAVSVPNAVTIDSGRFTTNLVIGVTHANLNAGNANKLVLNLSAAGIKVSGSYGTVTITLNKQ